MKKKNKKPKMEHHLMTEARAAKAGSDEDAGNILLAAAAGAFNDDGSIKNSKGTTVFHHSTEEGPMTKSINWRVNRANPNSFNLSVEDSMTGLWHEYGVWPVARWPLRYFPVRALVFNPLGIKTPTNTVYFPINKTLVTVDNSGIVKGAAVALQGNNSEYHVLSTKDITDAVSAARAEIFSSCPRCHKAKY